MIIGYTGMPGSGKTMALAWRARKALKEGRMVFSNVNIKGTYKITFDDIIHYRFPEGSVILIDEAGRWFNSRKWASLPEDVFDMFTMHRHLRMDLIVAVQSFARIDKSLREVIELVYWARNHPAVPFHRYEGYYDLEKVGSMRKEHDVSHIIWKTRKTRGMFNTHSMKEQFAHKEEIPLVEWKAYKRLSNKKFYRIWQQQTRIAWKQIARKYDTQTRERRALKEYNRENHHRFINMHGPLKLEDIPLNQHVLVRPASQEGKEENSA